MTTPARPPSSADEPLDLSTLGPGIPSRPVELDTPISIGRVRIRNRVALAPMAGVSVQAFRRQGQRFGVGLTCTEMVSACGLHYANERTNDYLRIAADEHPICVQLFGTDPALMREAAQMAAEAGADIIDINMGCPVRKVTRTAAGCKLLDDPARAVAVAAAVVEATVCPVTVKIRRGMKPGSLACLDLAPRLEQEAGIAALTLHPRSASQMYSGFADHAVTARLALLVSIPVFASGDITDYARACAVLDRTGAAGVMIGRAAQGNPWALRQILTGQTQEPSTEERVGELVHFIRGTVRELGERRATGFLRKFYGWYLRGTAFGRAIRRDMMLLSSPLLVEQRLLELWPQARTVVDELDRTVPYPTADDRVLQLPISSYGGG